MVISKKTRWALALIVILMYLSYLYVDIVKIPDRKPYDGFNNFIESQYSDFTDAFGTANQGGNTWPPIDPTFDCLFISQFCHSKHYLLGLMNETICYRDAYYRFIPTRNYRGSLWPENKQQCLKACNGLWSRENKVFEQVNFDLSNSIGLPVHKHWTSKPEFFEMRCSYKNQIIDSDYKIAQDLKNDKKEVYLKNVSIQKPN